MFCDIVTGSHRTHPEVSLPQTPYEIDLDQGWVRTDVGPASLTPHEVGLLRHLGAHAGRPVAREELLRAVWGYAPGIRSRTVDTTVQRLRAKIERDPDHPVVLVTVRGQGYAWIRPGEPLTTAPAPASPLFPRLDDLVGRASEVRDTIGLLHGGYRLVTLTGPSGVGKTWVARRVLTQIVDNGRLAVWFADATAASTTADLLDALATALAIPSPLRDPLSQVRAHLRALGPSVGVVDGAQGLEDDALRVLSGLVQTTPEISALVTSQRLLGLEGERRQPVEPLGDDDAVAVLKDRLEAMAVPLPPAGLLASLAARVGGLPLALELVAPLLDILSVDELLAADELPLATVARPDMPDRHRSLDAAISASVARLAAPDRLSLLRLSVFAGPFSRAAAAAVDAEVSLASLQRGSFLSRRPDGKFALYDGIRVWARQRLRAEGGFVEASRAHTAWLVAQVRQRADDLSHADLVAALRGDPGPALSLLVSALLRLVGHRGPITRLHEVISGLLLTERPVREQIILLNALSDAHLILGAPDPEPALEALALANLHGDEAGAIYALALISSSYVFMVDDTLALAYAREALARAEGLGERGPLYKALISMGHALDHQKDMACIAIYERAANVAIEMGEPLYAAIAWGNRGKARSTEGDKEAAIADYQRALAAVGDSQPRFSGQVCINLGGALCDLGRTSEAERAFDEGRARCEQAGDSLGLIVLELRSIDIDLWRGAARRAQRRLRALLDTNGLPPGFREAACVSLAVLTEDTALLPEEEHPFRAAAAAVIAGNPIPEGLHKQLVDRLTLLVRARADRQGNGR